MPFGTLLLVGIAVGAVLWFRRHPTTRGRAVRLSAFCFLALVIVLFASFAVAETFADPGGWAALGWVSAWALPLLAIVALAWLRPGRSVPFFWAMTAVVLGLLLWAAADTSSWRAFEDDHGPVRTIVVFVLVAGLAVLGLNRPRDAGLMLVILGLAPSLMSLLGGPRGGSLFVAVTPALLGGALYLMAAHLDGPTPPAPSGPRRRQLTG